MQLDSAPAFPTGRARRGLNPDIRPRQRPMKLEKIRVESFATTDDEVALMPMGTWMDATAGCCAPQEPIPDPYPRTFFITCRAYDCIITTDDYPTE
jgi:hypothetical protein